MKNGGLVATIIIMAGVIIMLLVTLFLIKMPTSIGIFEKAEEIVSSKFEPKTKERETVIDVPQKITTSIERYSGYDGNVEIEYPEIFGMKDKELQSRINYKIKTNALSIVGLYPVSTNVQRLDVYSDVKYIDDNTITIVYTGRLVGTGSTETEKNISTSVPKSSTTRKASVDNDPYLNGFVDPLAGGNIGLPNTQFAQPFPSNNSSLPTPTNNQNSITSLTPKSNVSRTETYQNQNGGSKVVSNGFNRYASDGHTSDSGPTVQEITAPTAKGSFKSENYSDGPGVAASYPSGTVNTTPPSYVTNYASSKTGNKIDKNIYFTNVIDLRYCVDKYLTEIVAADELAKYVRSSNVEFANVDDANINAVKAYLKKTAESKYVKSFGENSDFRNEQLSSWPAHFSYEDDEYIYVSINVTSNLGDYVVVKYPKY